MPRLQYLNLGCGQHFHRDWFNVDIVSDSEYVQAHDLRQGIPFADNFFEVVYHSNILEHFEKDAALFFVQECERVLKPGGVLRIATPDLHRIAQEYLRWVAAGLENFNDVQVAANYDWIMLEMYDQVVRKTSGGQMMTYLKQVPINEAYLIERCGREVENLLHPVPPEEAVSQLPVKDPSWLSKLFLMAKNPFLVKEAVVKRLLGQEYTLLQRARFRNQGEIHQWMYDRYSLTRLLNHCGINDVSFQSAHKSQVPNWSVYHLDVSPKGDVYKPDSMFVEGRKQ